MKKICLVAVLVVSMMCGVVSSDSFDVNWNVNNTTTTFRIRDGKNVRHCSLMNLTTAYVNFEIKASSSAIGYVLVEPNGQQIYTIEDKVNALVVSVAENQPKQNGFNGGVSSSTALGCFIRYW